MLGDYSIMDWVTLGGVLTTIGAIIGTIVKLTKDNRALMREIEFLAKENERLSQGLSRKVSSEREIISKENDSIKEDTDYIAKEFLKEQMARENLYKNTDRAKEILETMDMMKEVVMQNAQLNATVTQLKVENQELLHQKTDDVQKLLGAVTQVRKQLINFEEHKGFEETDRIFREIQQKFSGLL